MSSLLSNKLETNIKLSFAVFVKANELSRSSYTFDVTKEEIIEFVHSKLKYNGLIYNADFNTFIGCNDCSITLKCTAERIFS